MFGVLTILAPFSGLPVSMRTLLSVIFGAGVVVIGLIMRESEATQHREPVVEVTPAETPTVDPEPEAKAPHGVSPI